MVNPADLERIANYVSGQGTPDDCIEDPIILRKAAEELRLHWPRMAINKFELGADALLSKAAHVYRFNLLAFAQVVALLDSRDCIEERDVLVAIRTLAQAPKGTRDGRDQD